LVGGFVQPFQPPGMFNPSGSQICALTELGARNEPAMNMTRITEIRISEVAAMGKVCFMDYVVKWWIID
jgi:hypothetical protein